jgi:hypothetical protein
MSRREALTLTVIGIAFGVWGVVLLRIVHLFAQLR